MMHDAPRRTLVELVSRHGRGLAEEPRRCEALLRDHCGEYRREVSALVTAFEEHVPKDLLAAPDTTPPAVLLARLARRLSDHLALSEAAAQWSVNSWALALGVISDDELKTLELQAVAHAGGADASTPTIQRDASQQVVQGGAARQVATGASADPHAGANAGASADTAASITVVVAAQGGGDYASIGEALRNAAPGSRLLVRPGVYEEGLTIDRRVEIVGDGPAEEIVVRSDASSCVRMLADRARVAGLTLRGVAGGGGEGFFAVDIARGRLLLEDCDITSETLSCVAVHGDSADPLIQRCRIHDGADSGLYFFDGAAGTLEECFVHANTNVGIAITGGANPRVVRSKIYGGANAGVAAWDEGLGVLEGCEIFGNRLTGVGVSGGARLSARGCRIRDGDNTGVFVHHDGDATLEACDIHGHREAEVAVETRGQLTALRCEIHDGHSTGVFVRDGGQALLQESAVRDNTDDGVSIGGGSLAVVLGCRVNGNGRAGVRVAGGAAARVGENDLTGNRSGAWDVEEGAFVEGGDNVE